MDDSIIVLDGSDSTIVLDGSESEFCSDYETNLHDDSLMNIETIRNSTPKHALLESVHARFEQNKKESSRRISALKSRRLFEQAHRNHLIKNVIGSPNNAISRDSLTPIDNENLSQILTSDYHHAKRKFSETPPNNTKRLCASTSFHRNNTDTDPIFISNSLPSTLFSLSLEGCCPIIGCGIKMSSPENLERHMMSPMHTPCNPFQNILDSSLADDNVIFYLCPKCGQQFKDIKICCEHQERELHNEFIQPIAVSSFLCPLCLHIFPTESSCIDHMHMFQHMEYQYVFSNDKSGINCKPIPLPKHLAFDFKSKCDNVNSWVTCVDCNLKLTDVKGIQHHLELSHLLSCVADKKPADVFSEYLGEVSCSRCQQIFQTLNHKMFGKLHSCTILMNGIFQATDCRSFEEFVRRSSIAIQIENMPPPSPSTIINSERNQKRTSQSKLLFQNSQSKRVCLSAEASKNVHPIGTKITKLNSKTQSLRKPVSECRNGRVSSTSNSKSNSDNIFSIENPFKNLKIQIENTGHQKSQFPQASEFKAPLIWDTQDLDGCKMDEKLTEKLRLMNQIIFLDLDNWPCFFRKLPFPLPDLTFVWAFYGGKTFWNEPNCNTYDALKEKGNFHLNKKSGRTKDAADFALVLHVGKMDERLPKHIPFTILSGDKGFLEIENQMKTSKRHAKVIDPHQAQKESYDFLYVLLKSVGDK